VNAPEVVDWDGHGFALVEEGAPRSAPTR
jgi:hypothetical protein